jgi:hypothetical protein
MKRRHFALFCFGFTIFTLRATAQDTLPRFSVKNIGGTRFVIGWVNNYDTVKQISIQRSFDSVKNYTTILSVLDPNAKLNGFVDTKAVNDHMFYRLFVVLDKGQYLFTEARKPVLDTASKTASVESGLLKKDSALLKPVVTKKPDFIPSFYVYTNKDGYLFINLPNADEKKYHIKFFDEGDDLIFELKQVKEAALTLDKTNFLHAGWFRFELYDGDKLVERNKFYLAKEF